MFADVTAEELSATLDAVASDILDRTGSVEPPIDALAIAHALGMTVALDERQPGRARIAKLPTARGTLQPSIFLKPEPRAERQQWAIAHEIGESLAARVFSQLGIDATTAPRAAREQVANGIAGRILLPGATFANDGSQCGWDLLALKELYATASHELIARRMLDCGPQVIVAVWDQNKQTWRKSNGAARVPKPSEAELRCRAAAHAAGDAACEDGPPRVQAWAIHEPLWQREIVRVEIDEFAEGW